VSLSSDRRVLAVSTATARADLAAIYTWRTWLAGWLLRVLAQVVFFALLGRLLGSPATARFLVVGNSVAIVVMEAMLVIASSTWERAAGTLPLLVAAPGRLPLVFVGRSAQWLADGVACATVAFVVVGALFGVPMPFPRVLLVVPLIALVGAATYALGLVVAAVVLRAMGLRHVASNSGYLLLMAVTGVEVPRSYWPGWLQGLAQVLPVTHGLDAIRAVVGDGPLSVVARDAAAELAVGVGWLIVAMVAFTRLAESGRRDGSIEFG
jgi:ABC-2 type transport system permease protein